MWRGRTALNEPIWRISVGAVTVIGRDGRITEGCL